MCCSAATTRRARRIADSLSIPHYVIDMREDFEHHVIERFIEEYRGGKTPNPCVLCNRYVKFGAFIQKARAIGADYVATGHYGSIEETREGLTLKKGKDRTKDQSYFLYPIRKGDLDYIMFPLGGVTKKAVRQGFERLAISRERLEESQDICFVPENDYRAFVRQFISARPGPILDGDRKQIGSHEGVHFYTIGQRRGIGIPHDQPLYVTAIDAENNLVVVDTKERLKRRRLIADEVNLLSAFTDGRGSAKVRYRHVEEACCYSIKDGLLDVTFDMPTSSVTPGQSVVIYDNDTVIAGGTIRTAE
jgi:tRNA-specific 2-thiouridylase